MTARLINIATALGRPSSVSKVLAALVVVTALGAPAIGQTSSIRVRHARMAPPAPGAYDADPRVHTQQPGNPMLERHSFSAVKVKPPKKFQLHDLVTIVIREQRKYESDSELETKKKFDLQSTLNAFLKVDGGKLGASTFPLGKPNVDFKFKNTLKHEAEKDREDRFTTRITASVIDIKPNGNLVLEARARVTFDDEETVVALTGVARSVDISPDNTVLSTQLADKDIVVHNTGAVRDGSRRGWIPRVLDIVRPF